MRANLDRSALASIWRCIVFDHTARFSANAFVIDNRNGLQNKPHHLLSHQHIEFTTWIHRCTVAMMLCLVLFPAISKTETEKAYSVLGCS